MHSPVLEGKEERAQGAGKNIIRIRILGWQTFENQYDVISMPSLGAGRLANGNH